MKKILTSAILFGILVVVAQAVNINPNIPYNPAISQKPSDTPGGIIANFYQFSLLIGGLLALGAIVYGATKYTLAAGNPSGQGDAKDQILQALLGLLLLVGAYLVLYTLNPDIIKLDLPTLEPIKTIELLPANRVCQPACVSPRVCDVNHASGPTCVTPPPNNQPCNPLATPNGCPADKPNCIVNISTGNNHCSS